MKKTPFFSIIIPTYNRASFLPKAVESVLEQSCSDWELIVVDDASDDNTQEILNTYTDPRIVKVKNEKNMERSASRNRGIALAKGQYICFLDSDDYFLHNRLELLKLEIEKRNFPVALIYTGLKYVHGLVLDYSNDVQNRYRNTLEYLLDTVIGVPQVCVHKNILEKHRFNKDIYIGEDTELFLRIAKDFPILYFDNQITVVAREHHNRSVNEKIFNPGKAQLKMFKCVFGKSHSGKDISSFYKSKKMSDALFSIARHYMYNNKKISAAKYVFLSIINCPQHIQTKHKFLILLNLVSGRLLPEYKKI